MSMQPIVFKVALFRGDFDQARSQYSLLWLMEALVRINQSHIRQYKKLAQEKRVPAPYPALYRSGIHYEPEPGTEEWLDIPNMLAVHGGTFPGPWADCEDLACWRTAELREQGVKAKPFAKWRLKPDGSYAYHALTLLPDGRLEDPSLVLGMGNEPEFARLRMAERYKDGTMTPSIRYAKTPDVVVVDKTKPSGVSKDIKGAQKRTGLLSKAPPSGSPVDGMITGKTQSEFPDVKGKATSDEDGSIYANIQGDGAPAWGYDRRQVREADMRKLMAHQNRMRRQGLVPGSMMGAQLLGRIGRQGRIGHAEAAAARRFNTRSIPNLPEE